MYDIVNTKIGFLMLCTLKYFIYLFNTKYTVLNLENAVVKNFLCLLFKKKIYQFFSQESDQMSYIILMLNIKKHNDILLIEFCL